MAELDMDATGLVDPASASLLEREYVLASPFVFGCVPGASYHNRVWDTMASGFVRWATLDAADPTGAQYPGPGTFGIHTDDFCVEYIENEVEEVEVEIPLWTPGEPDLTRDCELWLPLGGDAFGKAPGNFVSQFTHTQAFCPSGAGMGLAQDNTNPLRVTGYNVALDPTTYATPWNFTICMGVWMWAYRASCSWARCDTYAGGNSEYQWYMAGDGSMRVGHDKPDWESTTSTTPVIPALLEWNFLAFTMNADGITGTFTCNDQTETYALTTPSTKSGQTFTLGDSWNTSGMDGAFSAVLVESRVESPAELQVIRTAMMGL